MQQYDTGFFLASTDANMQFAHPKSPLRVAPMLETTSLDKLAIEEQHFAFAEKNERGEIQYFPGLKHFLNIDNTYIFDNHNHALFFWYQEYLRTKKICKCIHIDQHSDMRDNQFFLPFDLLELDRSDEVFQFVQQQCNVGNFLQPALKSGLISEIHPILTEYALQHFQLPKKSYILDIDLDFRAPEMGNDFATSLPILQTLLQNAECVTIATSPYFLNQKLAIKLIHKIVKS